MDTNYLKPMLKRLELIFEKLLWKSRLIILIAVIFSVIAATALFLAGSYEIFESILHALPKDGHELDYAKLLAGIIGAVDLYLIGIVLLIFAFGIYELFISKIDIARDGSSEHNILEITSLEELKSKLMKVIVMALIVTFFKTVLSASFQTPLEMLYFAISILAIAGCTFFLHTIDKDHQ